MMDIEKLIEQLRKSADFEDYPIVASFAAIIEKKYLRDAATALSTLQAKNAQLRESRDHWKRLAHELSEGINGKDAEHERLQAKNEKLRAELEQVKRERDAAVKDMEALMWFSGEGCHICAHEIIIHREPYVRSECALGNAAVCCPTWRGPKKED